MNAASLLRLFALAALWGGSFLFMRVAAPALGAIPTTFGRVALGALGLVAVVLVMRVPLRFRGRLRAVMWVGVINSAIPFLMFATAARVLPAGYSAILNATAPLMGIVIGALVFGERITVAKAGGVGLGLLGVAVLVRAGPVALSVPVLASIGACLAATACYGLAGFLTRRMITERGGLESRLVALGSQLGAVMFVAPFFAWHAAATPVVAAAVGVSVWLSLLALGLLSTSLAYVLYFRLIADVGPVKSLTVAFLIPLFGVLWGWLFLDESLTFAHLAGGGLIAIALGLVLRPAPGPAKPA